MKLYACFVFVFSLSLLSAREVIRPDRYKEYKNPWTTGPLLCPSTAAVTIGHVNFEPYFTAVANTGSYNKHGKAISSTVFWNNYFQPDLQVGVTSFMDVQIAPILNYNYTDHQAKWVFGDFPLTVDIQIAKPRHQESFVPYIKLVFMETFPTGKYKNLNPKKLSTDSGGAGTFETSVGIVAGELFHVYKSIFITPRLYIVYNIPAPTKLKGFNAYGGGYGTKARLIPGQSLYTDLAFELSLSRNWTLACDFVNVWVKKSKFTGDPGKNADGTVASLGKQSSYQFSMAPAIEYNFNSHVGIITGGWFTAYGRNSAKFWSSMTALNVYY